MRLINCKDIREEVLQEVEQQVEQLDFVPQIHIITIGEDDASKVYVSNKIKTAKSVGIKPLHYEFSGDITQEQAEEEIKKLCSEVQGGVMLQLPIPSHLDEAKLIDLIPQNQDVDGLTATNMGMLVQNNRDAIIPATANACYYVMKHFFDQEDMSNVNVTIVNRSRLIGLPLQALLTNNNATVTLCHSKTRNLPVPMIKSDVLITGIGKPKFFNSQDCSDEYQLIIDCGINRDEDGRMCGDWNEESLFEVCDDSVHLTPVGKKRAGVGSIVTACLMQSVLKCYQLQGGE